MFPSAHDHQSKDLEYPISSAANREDLMQPNMIMRGTGSHEVLPSDLQGGSLCSIYNNEAKNNIPTDPYERKILRRDNERQRRQVMAIHTASLRSLLPHGSIKGKGSLPEHINEAVNYIKHLKEKIQELNTKREELRRVHQYYSSSANDLSQEINGNLGTKSTSNIMVGPTCWGGVEIVASGEIEGFSLSGLLKTLVAERLSVVECASTTINQRLFHTIHCEVDNLACLDLCKLHLRLNFSCNSG